MTYEFHDHIAEQLEVMKPTGDVNPVILDGRMSQNANRKLKHYFHEKPINSSYCLDYHSSH